MTSADWRLASRRGTLIWVKDASRAELYSELSPTLIVARKTRGESAVDYVKFSNVVSARQEGTNKIVLQRRKGPLLSLIACDATDARHWFEAIQLSMTKFQSSIAPATATNWVDSSMSRKPPLPTAERSRTAEQNCATKDTPVVEVNRVEEEQSLTKLLRVSEENFLPVQNRVAECLKETETTLPLNGEFISETNNAGGAGDVSSSDGVGDDMIGMEGVVMQDDEITPQNPENLDLSRIQNDYVMNCSKELKENGFSIEGETLLRSPLPIFPLVDTISFLREDDRFDEMPDRADNEQLLLHNKVLVTANDSGKPLETSLSTSPLTPLKNGFTVSSREGNSSGSIPLGKEFSWKMPSAMIPLLSDVDTSMQQCEGAKPTEGFVETVPSVQEDKFHPHASWNGSSVSNATLKLQRTDESASNVREIPSLIRDPSQTGSFTEPSADVHLLGFICMPLPSEENSGVRVCPMDPNLEKRQSHERIEENQNIAHSLHFSAVENDGQALRESILDGLCNESVSGGDYPPNKNMALSGHACSTVSLTEDLQQTPCGAQEFVRANIHRRSASSQTEGQEWKNSVVDPSSNILLRSAPRDRSTTVLLTDFAATYSSLRSLEREDLYCPINASVSAVPRRRGSVERSHIRGTRSVECRGEPLYVGCKARDLSSRRNGGHLSVGNFGRCSDYFVVQRNSPLRLGYSPRLSLSRRRSSDEADYVRGIVQQQDREIRSRNGDVDTSHDETLQSRLGREGRHRYGYSRRLSLEEEEQPWRFAHDRLMEPCLATKHDLCGYGSSKHYFCVTRDAKHVVCIPVEDYTKKGSLSIATPLSLNAAIFSYGARCRAMAIKSIDHVSLGTRNDFVRSWNLHRSASDRLVCLVSKTHAFVLEVESSIKATNLVKVWKEFLRYAPS